VEGASVTMSFNEWKERLEAAASKFNDLDAVNEANLQKGAEYYSEFMGVIQSFLAEIDRRDLPEEKKIEVASGFLQSIVDDMTRGCEIFTRQHPEEAEALLDFYESHIEFFKNMIADLQAGVVVDANHVSREEEQ
jgi:hypothetical protein